MSKLSVAVVLVLLGTAAVSLASPVLMPGVVGALEPSGAAGAADALGGGVSSR